MRKAVIIVGLLFALNVMAYAVIISPEHLIDVRVGELDGLDQVFGEAGADDLRRRSDGWFDALFGRSGIHDASYRLFVPERDDLQTTDGTARVAQAIFPHVAQRLDVFWLWILQTLLRLATVVAWLPLLALAAWPCAVDGWVVRQIRRTNFDFSSPVAYNLAAIVLTLSLIACGLILFLPITITPLLVPACATLLVLSSWVMTRNLQKKL